MSFTTEVKSEIGQNRLNDCCTKAQLAALIQLCSTIVFNNKGMSLTIRIENATTAKRIWKLVKDSYDAEMELSVLKKMNLKKNNVYIIKIITKVDFILNDLNLLVANKLQEHPSYRLVRKECCARAYLAGAFLASGSANSPTKSNYHLEIATLDVNHAIYIQKLMKRFELPAKYIQRRNQHVVYLKASEKISDFLRCIGAYNAVMNFEDMRIQRDFRNSLTRLDNCEVANEMKTMRAGKKQLEDIALLEKYGKMTYLDKKLQEVAGLRKLLPEASLNDLCTEYEKQFGIAISKSGMKHRLAKISEIALKLSD